MTEADYNKKIAANNDRIAALKREIAKLEDEADALKKMKQKTAEMEEEMERVANTLSNRFSGSRTLIGTITSFLKADVFSDILDVLKGAEYKEATNGLDEMAGKIQKRTKEVEEEIEAKEREIKRLQSSNTSLGNQKKEFLASQAADTNM